MPPTTGMTSRLFDHLMNHPDQDFDTAMLAKALGTQPDVIRLAIPGLVKRYVPVEPIMEGRSYAGARWNPLLGRYSASCPIGSYRENRWKLAIALRSLGGTVEDPDGRAVAMVAKLTDISPMTAGPMFAKMASDGEVARIMKGPRRTLRIELLPKAYDVYCLIPLEEEVDDEPVEVEVEPERVEVVSPHVFDYEGLASALLRGNFDTLGLSPVNGHGPTTPADELVRERDAALADAQKYRDAAATFQAQVKDLEKRNRALRVELDTEKRRSAGGERTRAVELQQLIDIAEDTDGWSVERSTAHVTFIAPDGEKVGSPSTPSDWRSMRNVRADLRRRGLDC